MNFWYQLTGDWQSFPLIAVALHSGHTLNPSLDGLMALTDQERLTEEDPFTDQLTLVAPGQLIVALSRFKVDFNREEELCLYLQLQESFGLTVWKSKPSPELIQAARAKHQRFYQDLFQIFSRLGRRFPAFIVLAIHSYDQRRVEPEKSPDIDVGTWLNQLKWRPLIDRFLADLARFDFFGQRLIVKENTRFETPGFFEIWLSQAFPQSCCLSIEVAKQLFMNEQKLEVNSVRLQAIKDCLAFALRGVKEELKPYALSQL